MQYSTQRATVIAAIDLKKYMFLLNVLCYNYGIAKRCLPRAAKLRAIQWEERI